MRIRVADSIQAGAASERTRERRVRVCRLVAALAATPLYAEQSEALERSVVIAQMVSLLWFLDGIRGRAFILLIQLFKIQVQGPNLRYKTGAYGSKSEKLGGIGEK